VLNDPEASQYVDGVAYHWYTHFEGLYENDAGGPALGPVSEWLNIPAVGGGAQVRTIGAQHPDKFFLMTEACNGFALGTSMVGPRAGDWGYGRVARASNPIMPVATSQRPDARDRLFTPPLHTASSRHAPRPPRLSEPAIEPTRLGATRVSDDH
jgi:hypothetical protein